MTKYAETIKKWDEVAKRGDIAAIHPAGNLGYLFCESGRGDAIRILDIVHKLKLSNDIFVLDYGCGPGRVTKCLVPIFSNILGYDTANQPELIDHPDISFFTNSSLLKKEFVDLAFSISVFIHHTYSDGVRMMQEVADIVKPGGYLLLQIPIYDVAREAENWTGVSVWNLDQFNTAVEHCGLIVIETHSNPGAFSYDKVGANHHMFQILKKPE